MKKPALLTDILLSDVFLSTTDLELHDPYPDLEGKIAFKLDFTFQDAEKEKIDKGDIFSFASHLDLTAYDGQENSEDDGEDLGTIVLEISFSMLFLFYAKKNINVETIKKNQWVLEGIMRPIIINKLKDLAENTPLRTVPDMMMMEN